MDLVRGTFYRVRACPECQAVWMYRAWTMKGGWEWLKTSCLRNGVCQACGAPWSESIETTAAWVSTWVLHLPWTWFSGYWITRDQLPPDEITKLITRRR